MKEVVIELEGLRIMEKHRWESDKSSLEENENLLKASSSVFNVDYGAGGRGIISRFDSISRITVSLVGGR